MADRRGARRDPIPAVNDHQLEEQKTREVVKAPLRPYKRVIQSLIAVVLIALYVSASMGAWLFACVLLLTAVTFGLFFGRRLMMLSPAGDTERSLFIAALDISGVGSSNVPMGCQFALWPMRPLLVPFARAKTYIRSAKTGEPGVRWLLDRSASPESFDRWRALVTLMRMKEDRAIPALTKALGDSHPSVRAVAAKGLAAFGQTDQLASGLRDDSEDVLWLYATAAVVSARQPVEIPEWRLVRLVNSAPIINIGADRKELLLNSDRDNGWDDERDKAFGTLPIEATHACVREFLNRRPQSATSVLKAVGAQGTDHAREFLIELLEDRPEDIIRSSPGNVRRFDIEARSLLNSGLARAALYGLGETGDTLALPCVERVQAEHPDRDVRRLAALIAEMLRKTPDR